MMLRLTILLFLPVFLAACLKPPDYNEIPSVKVESLSPTLIYELVDSTILRFSFTDGDGDIGSPYDVEPRPVTIYVTDLRTGKDKLYRMPDVSPSGNSRVISGEVRLAIVEFCRCYYTEQYDTLFYAVRISDQAGNISNVDTSAIALVVECNPDPQFRAAVDALCP